MWAPKHETLQLRWLELGKVKELKPVYCDGKNWVELIVGMAVWP